ncbi:MAG: sigma-70 family RNA polymerase sigma factor [Clostridia bacterium]|nr:sigma-70 family RNA polymerase sigma factor [Clostridia bacterium]
MDDRALIGLYNERSECAIGETAKKYGAYVRRICYNITGDAGDSEELENDTYLVLWSKIPPDDPKCFSAYIGRIARNLSVSRYRSSSAKKRTSGAESIESELAECFADHDADPVFDRVYLTEVTESFLRGLSKDDRVLFVRRYWYGDAVKDLSREVHQSPSRVAKRLYRLRAELKAHLEEKGVSL